MIMTNIIKEKEMKEITKHVLKFIVESISTTLGPFGSPTTYQSKTNFVSTKDGYNVLKNTKFADSTHQSILSIIKKISGTLVREVGDGSTTATVSAYYLYNELDKIYSKGNLRRKHIFDTITKVSKMIETKILELTTKIDEDNFEKLKDVIYTSLNSDQMIADNLYELFKECGINDPIIYINKSLNERFHQHVTKGFIIPCSMAAKDLINDVKNKKKIIEDSDIYIFRNIIDFDTFDRFRTEILEPDMILGDKKIVLVSPGFSETVQNVLGMMTQTYIEPFRKKFCPLYIPFDLHGVEDYVKDLAIYTGAKAIDPMSEDMKELKSLHEIAGKVDYVESTFGTHETLFRSSNYNQDELNLRIEDVQSMIDHEIGLREISIKEINSEFKLRERLKNLQGNNVTAHFYVGGATEEEKEMNKDLVEDAIKASRSALKYGYNIGGSLIIPIAIDKLKQEKNFSEFETEIADKIRDAFKSVFVRVFKNAEIVDKEIDTIFDTCVKESISYDLIGEKYDDNEKIINSSRTDIEILRSTLNIVSILLSSKQYLIEEPIKEYHCIEK